MSDLEREAARLSRETQFSHARWLTALLTIGGYEGREALVRLIREISAVSGTGPDEVARILVGDGDRPGLALDRVRLKFDM